MVDNHFFAIVDGFLHVADLSSLGFSPETFLRGDCNDDGTVDSTDAVCILEWLFHGTVPGSGLLISANRPVSV